MSFYVIAAIGVGDRLKARLEQKEMGQLANHIKDGDQERIAQLLGFENPQILIENLRSDKRNVWGVNTAMLIKWINDNPHSDGRLVSDKQ